MVPVIMTLGESFDKIFYSFDMWAFSFFGNIQCTFFTALAKVFTVFGDEAFVIPIVVLAVVLSLFKKTRKYGVTLIFAIIIGTLITNVVAKPMALRIRPYNTLQDNAEYWAWYLGAGALSENDYSFPSGHTTAAFEIATALFLCFKSNKKKIAYIFPLIALCTMGSRVYLMVHYASDVIGGLIIGVFSGAVAYLLMKLCKLIAKKIKPFGKLNNLDAGKIFKGKLDGGLGTAIICVAVVGLFLYAFIPSLAEGGEEEIRCSYNEEYDCYNAAKDEYEIDGYDYCKIHFNQLVQE